MDNPSSAFTFDASQDMTSMHPNTPSDLPTEIISDQPEKIKLIWGTTINISETIEAFKEILDKHYQSRIRTMISLDQNSLFIDDLYDLNQMCVNYPSEIIPILRKGLNEYILEKEPSFRQTEIEIGIDAPAISLRKLCPSRIDKVVRIKGIVMRVSTVIPELIKGCYVCSSCGKSVVIEKIKNVIQEPGACDCGSFFSYSLSYERSEYLDKQVVKIQEMESEQEPMCFNVVSYVIDRVMPGDRVEICGILKAAPILNPFTKKVKNVFRGYVEMLSVKKENEEGSAIDEDLHKENVEQENSAGKKNTGTRGYFVNSGGAEPITPDRRYERMAEMIAPSVYGHHDVKKGILLMMVGGVRKNHFNCTLRGSINILLAGDPGVAKSQLLTFVNQHTKGIYTSGQGSSAVGLSASVTRDVETGQFVLESGALVLSDHGVCIIDEFDKMNNHSRGVLHEAMEQQSISIAKAGIITSLNCRCSILASCNPVNSVWDTKKSIIENVNLPATLLSRFDLIFILLDRNDKEQDERTARFIIDVYNERSAYDKNVLMECIAQSKAIIPVISREAEKEIEDRYVELRSLNNGNTITATTRQLEAIIRLSEAHARVRLSEVVEKEDVAEAVRLIKESMLMYAIDPLTGKLDIDLVMAGRSAGQRKMLEELKKRIQNVLKKRKRCKMAELATETGESERSVKEAVDELCDEEMVVLEEDVVQIIE
ncbi:DNA replication licensing factor, MCM4 component [Trachipleistophora hominis]|uniref:DNA replication licensing factor MCM4 n=1 Tax=Trachipleistophora hominis TaxID=72359 RepID=L7JQV5_TRAHO|nr:DNA replication licensing factor, MCM4 component [Trachipleistophora hominis]